MAITSIGGNATTATPGLYPAFLMFGAAGAYKAVRTTIDPGYYKISVFNNNPAGGTITATIRFFDTTETVTTVDDNSGDGLNPSVGYLNVTTALSGFYVYDLAGRVLMQKIADPLTTVTYGVTVYSTSQTVTLSKPADAFICGGGGGGNGAYYASMVGGGGGSGAGGKLFSVNPGTYSLVVGAGGTNGGMDSGLGGNGGSTTFAGQTAIGGNAGTSYSVGGVAPTGANAFGGNGGDGGYLYNGGGAGASATAPAHWVGTGTTNAFQGGSPSNAGGSGGGGLGKGGDGGVGGAGWGSAGVLGAGGGGGNTTGGSGGGGGAGGDGALVIFSEV